MMNRFSQLALCLGLVLHTAQVFVESFSVSKPLDHTLNADGSVSVTCRGSHKEVHRCGAALLKNDTIICDLLNTACAWRVTDNCTFIFTFNNLEAEDRYQPFSCMMTRAKPLPILTETGQKTKLFPGCNIPFPPPVSRPSNCSKVPHVDVGTRVLQPYQIYCLAALMVLLSLYSSILTVVYIHTKIKTSGTYDAATYVPMNRKAKRRDLDNTEYETMHKFQKKDINQNSTIAG